MRTHLIWLTVILLFSGQALRSQCIDMDDTCTGQMFVMHLEVGQVLTGSDFEIAMNYGGDTDGSWSFCADYATSCAPADFSSTINFASDLNFNVNSAGTRARLTGTATTPGAYLITINIATGSVGDQQREYLFVVREPIRLVFVLDKSGSMSSSAPGGLSSKWSMAQDAIENFASGLSIDTLSLLPNDRIGLVAFADDAESPTLPSANFQQVSQFQTDAPLIFDPTAGGFVPGGWTSIGDGMEHSVVDLHGGLDTDFRQITVLISDGMQNEAAMIETGGKKLVGGGGLDLLNTPGAIDTYTVGFTHSDTPGAHEQLLINISSSATNENYFYTNDLGTYVPTFTEIFAQVFNRFSPQLVDINRVELPPPTTQGSPPVEQTFTINGNAKILHLQVNFNQDILTNSSAF